MSFSTLANRRLIVCPPFASHWNLPHQSVDSSLGTTSFSRGVSWSVTAREQPAYLGTVATCGRGTISISALPFLFCYMKIENKCSGPDCKQSVIGNCSNTCEDSALDTKAHVCAHCVCTPDIFTPFLCPPPFSPSQRPTRPNRSPRLTPSPRRRGCAWSRTTCTRALSCWVRV